MDRVADERRAWIKAERMDSRYKKRKLAEDQGCQENEGFSFILVREKI